MITTTTPLEIDSLKTRLKETWMAGDYDRFSRIWNRAPRIFYEQLDIPAGSTWLAARVRLHYGRRGME